MACKVCQATQTRERYIPIIMLTARADDVDKIVGLEVEADDYVTKPFNARKLETTPHELRYLLSVHSTGYKFATD